MFLVSRQSEWNGWNLFDDIGLTFLEMYIETMIGKLSMFFMCEDIYMNVWQYKKGKGTNTKGKILPIIKHVKIDLRYRD